MASVSPNAGHPHHRRAKAFSVAGQPCELRSGAVSGTAKDLGRSESGGTRVPARPLPQVSCHHLRWDARSDPRVSEEQPLENDRYGRDKKRLEEKQNDETNESWRHLPAGRQFDDLEPLGLWCDATCRDRKSVV